MDILIPISICCILPVMIVWLTMRTAQNETDRKAEVMIKAIEAGIALDANFFKAQQKRQKGLKERLLGRFTGACVSALIGIAMLITGILFCSTMPNGWSFYESPLPFYVLCGGILLSVGIALFIAYFAGRKMLAKEIEAEEKAAQQER